MLPSYNNFVLAKPFRKTFAYRWAYGYYTVLEDPQNSFLGSDSLKFLDLNLGEYSLFEKGIVNAGFPFRFDNPSLFHTSCKMFVRDEDLYSQALVEEWKTINSLHLDLPVKQELKMKNLSQAEGHWPYIKSFCIYPSNVVLLFYKNLFINIITSAIRQSDHKVDIIRKIFKPLLFILKPFQISTNTEYYQYPLTDFLLPILYEECQDSEVIKDFLCVFDFKYFIENELNPKKVEYLFHHAHEADVNLWGKIPDINFWVAECIINPRLERLKLFLKYHNTLELTAKYYEMQIVTLLANPLIVLLRLQGPFSQGRISQRRYLLCLLVLCCNRHRVTEKLFCNNEDPDAQDILRLIWKAIPDPYLSLEEVNSVYTSLKMSFTEHMFSENITEIFNYYSKTVSKIESHMEPRSLQHLCRMQIRESLSQNFQLPKGLKQLKMPSKFKTYLQLEL